MTRGPIVAWRRLFGVGGAPAASHAALARPLIPERLLAPLADTALVDATSLEALARPLDVSAVLARVLNATPAADATSPETEAPRRPRRAPPRAGLEDSSAVAPRPTIAGARADTATPIEEARGPRGENVRARSPRSPWSPAPVPTADAVSAPPGADRGTARVARAPSPSPTPGADGRRPRWRPPLGLQARIGAITPVVLGTPDEHLQRLLARGAPAAPVASAFAPPRTVAPARPASSDAEPDAAGLLDRAVERAGARGRQDSPTATPSDTRARGRAWTGDMIEPEPPAPPEPAASVAEEALPSGGFRGLARRALGARAPVRRLPVRLVPEPGSAVETRRNDLDACVAESLARILEREVRRHGIDVAGART